MVKPMPIDQIAADGLKPNVGILGRFPITVVIVLTYLLINGVSASILSFANSMAKSGYNDAWIFAFPLVLLVPLSHVILIVGGLISIPVDISRYSKKRVLGALKPSAAFNPVWLMLGILLFPTFALYRELAPFYLEPVWKDFVFATTASSKDKLNKEFRTILHYRYNRQQIEGYLNRGADINLTGQYDGTALMLAARAGDEDLVNKLLIRRADVNATEYWRGGKTALIFALEFEPGRPQLNASRKRIALNLVQHGANLAYSAGGESAMNTAIKCTKDKDLINKLLDAGAPVTAPTTTPLMTAAKIGDNEIISLLLARGADINDGALYDALFSQNLDTVRFLIAKGASVNKRAYGSSYLMLAAAWKSPEYMNTLLKAGAQVSGENEFGQTVLSQAALSGDLQRVKQLITLGAKIDPKRRSGIQALYNAIVGNNPKIVKLFIQQGVDVNATAPYQSLTMLEKAIVINNAEIVNLLREAGAKEKPKVK